MEGGEPTTKFLAFHKTAPIGTLIIVKNEANGQSVWVKVIGKLSGNSDAIIKISSKAYDKLQAKDRRIRASINYTLSGQ
jgi:rare lipoprotein A (peptidoglycan hydrolase)